MAHWLDDLVESLPDEGREDYKKALTQGLSALDFLAARNVVPPEELLDRASEHYRLPPLALAFFQPEEQAVELLTEELARRYGMLPLFLLGRHLYVAVHDPENLEAQDFVEQLTGLSLDLVLVLKPDLDAALNRVYLAAAQVDRAMQQITSIQTGLPEDLVEDLQLLEGREAPAVQLVDRILQQAIHLRASDVHLEIYAHRVELRYRVDGILHEFPAPPRALFPAVVSRIKIAARMDIAERRLPQDGRFTYELGGRSYDLRVAVIPSLHGEGVVIRLFNTSEMERRLGDLGFDPITLARYEVLVRRPHGMILVTGPTGSGKTTTLYATLRSLFTPRRKFVTLEDPVELQVDGVTQIQVRPEIGFHFAEGLRSVLRYDPDVVMVGEIRDVESAEIALRASLTGHLLLSTLHTNDAPHAVTRLVDMGIAPYKILAALACVLAQRLLRVLCPACRRPGRPTEAELAALGLDSWPEGVPLYRAQGCPECGGLGYRGRLAVYELLEVTPAMRRLREAEVTPDRLRELARERGFVTMRETALQRLYEGKTGIEEILALTAGE